MRKKNKPRKIQKCDFTKEQIRIGNIVTNLSLVFGVLGLALLYYFFITPEYDNVFSFTSIFWIFGLIGVSIYLYVHYKYVVKKVLYLKYLETKGRNVAGAILFSFVFFPSIIFFINNKFAKEESIFTMNLKVLEKSKTSRRISGSYYYSPYYNYYITVCYKSGGKKVLVEKEIWENTSVNDTVTLYIQTGALGLNFIRKVTT